MLSPTIKVVVSTAKRAVELRGRTDGRSLMKAENRVGPRSPGGPQKREAVGRSRSQGHE